MDVTLTAADLDLAFPFHFTVDDAGWIYRNIVVKHGVHSRSNRRSVRGRPSSSVFG